MSIFIERPNGQARFGRIFPPHDAWLDRQAFEEVIEPELPIVDAHHHLWDVQGHRYLIDEFLRDTDSGHRIVATVYVEALSMYREKGPIRFRSLGETEFANGMAAMSASGRYGSTRIASGIVGFVDLTIAGQVRPVLEAHLAASGGRLKGVRFGTAWDPDSTIGNSHNHPGPQQLRDPRIREALACVASLGLSFDALVHHPQLEDVADLAASMPDLPIVLNHLGTPLGYGVYAGRRDEVFFSWKEGLAKVARHPNVTVKVGGMTMRLAAFDYVALETPPTSMELADLWRPYVETCIDLFGAQRCMFQSNFPVDKMGTGYRVLWNAYKRIAAGASPSEKASLFHDTACRSYRLTDPEGACSGVTA